MAEVLVEFDQPLVLDDGRTFLARACGGEMSNGHWHGWLEFVSLDGAEVLRTGRETTQPNRTDTLYWATGLTPVYLEGALERTLTPRPQRPARPAAQPFYDEPAPEPVPPAARPESILNPFSVYRKGEDLLRDQLNALSARHLVNIIRDYALSAASLATLNRLPKADLIETIVEGVRREQATAR